MSLHLIISDILLNICHFSLGYTVEQPWKNRYDYADISEEKMGTPEDNLDGNIYKKTNATRLTPDSTYGI